MKLRDLVTAALLVSAGVVLNLFIRIPLLPNAPFLEYSPADVPTLLGTFALGPFLGSLIALLRAIIHFTHNTGGAVGLVMDIASGVTLAAVAGLIYVRWKTRTGAALALFGGSVAMIAVVMAINIFWAFPAFLGISTSEAANMALSTALPFNLIKCVLNGLIVFFLYKPLSAILHGRDASEKDLSKN